MNHEHDSPSGMERAARIKEWKAGSHAELVACWRELFPVALQSTTEGPPCDPTPFDPIARLHLQVGRRPQGTLGLFFSRAFSDSAIELATELRPIRVLLIRVEDVEWELLKQQPFDMLNLVRKKWRAAVMYARPDFELRLIQD
jgi:hypothetical protein